MSQPYIICLILNTDHRKDTLQCLVSLSQSTYQNHKAIVLDNASKDGSVEAVRTLFPAVEIIELAENHGYAGNNNVGIQAALAQGADWVLVLNEDTTLAPDCLAQLVEAGESSPQIGIVGPLVCHYDEPNVIQSAGGKIGRGWESVHIAKNVADCGQFREPRPVDWISGCGILVRRAVIEQVGLIDERYFYYWEETEWCLRAAAAGWGILNVPRAKLWHKGVHRDYHPKPQVTYYDTRNQLLTLAKHQAPVTAWILVWLRIIRTLSSWTVKPKWRSMREHRRAMFRGAVDFLLRRWGGPVQF
jgi:GT2 family glycosyltransferase